MNRLTIALSGLEDADVEHVRNTLDREDLSQWQLHEDAATAHDQADLLIVDVDSVWGHMDWLKSTARGQRTAGYSNQPPVHKGDLMLSKPLQGDHLAQLLHALVEDGLERHTEAHTSPQADADPAEPADMPAFHADTAIPHDDATAEPMPQPGEANAASATQTPTRSEPAADIDSADIAVAEPSVHTALPDTVGEWLLARLPQTPFALHHDGQSLLVDPVKGTYHGSAQLKPLIPFLQLAPDAALEPDASELAALDGTGQPIDRLLWLAALTATPGRLSTRHDSATTFRLDRWPQIEREFPRHFRIATAMMKQPGSLGELASAANTAEADVADFINAYTAVGHVAASDEEDGVTQTARPRLRKLFARSANR